MLRTANETDAAEVTLMSKTAWAVVLIAHSILPAAVIWTLGPGSNEGEYYTAVPTFVIGVGLALLAMSLIARDRRGGRAARLFLAGLCTAEAVLYFRGGERETWQEPTSWTRWGAKAMAVSMLVAALLVVAAGFLRDVASARKRTKACQR